MNARERGRERVNVRNCMRVARKKNVSVNKKQKKDKHTAIVPAEGLLSQVTSLQGCYARAGIGTSPWLFSELVSVCGSLWI